MNDIYIRSVGHCVPKGRIDNNSIMECFRQVNSDWLTNEEFESLNKETQIIFGFLGLKTRSVWEDFESENFISLAARSCQNALEKAGFSKDDVDCLILTGVGNPFREPTFANIVSSQLGCSDIDFFDVNDTCSGVLKSIEIASLYIRSGRYKNVLVCSCENNLQFAFSSRGAVDEPTPFFKIDDIKNFPNKLSTLVLGSGAGALLLSSEKGEGKVTKTGQYRDTDTWDRAWMSYVHELKIPSTLFNSKVKGFTTDSNSISKFLLNKIPEFVNKKLEEWDMRPEEIDHVITPQHGNNITYGILNGINIDSNKAINTFRELGNMGSANMPVNLAMAHDKGMIKSGDKILCICSGGGLSILLAIFEWL